MRTSGNRRRTGTTCPAYPAATLWLAAVSISGGRPVLIECEAVRDCAGSVRRPLAELAKMRRAVGAKMHKSDTDAKQRALTARIELQRASVDLDARSQSSMCAGRRLASAAEAVAGARRGSHGGSHKERMPDERMSDARSTWRTAVESQAEET